MATPNRSWLRRNRVLMVAVVCVVACSVGLVTAVRKVRSAAARTADV
jgi:cell division protein FtsL